MAGLAKYVLIGLTARHISGDHVIPTCERCTLAVISQDYELAGDISWYTIRQWGQYAFLDQMGPGHVSQSAL